MRKSITYVCVSLLPILLVVSVSLEYVLNFLEYNYDNDTLITKNITEIIQTWPNFKAEEHYITTDDGYKVLVERSYSMITQKNPIIIVHGIAMNAHGWVNRGNVSLARLLGELGYDVWMLNYRGTWYSKGHVNLTTSNKNYWNYTLDELGIYDIRSTVQLVFEKTQRQAFYIGYSMGTTGFFIYSSTFPEEAKQYVKAMIGLAPCIRFKSGKSILLFTTHIWPVLKWFVYTFWNGEILPSYSIFLRPLVRFPGGMYVIQTVSNLIFGDNYTQMDPLTFTLFATQTTDTAAAEVYTHYVQIYQTTVFKKYDYGRDKNLQVYGAATPPLYDLSKIPVSIALFTSENDWLVTMADAEQIYSEIQPSLRCGFHVISSEKWNHIDYLISKDLPKYLYRYLFEKIKDLGDEVCHT